MALGEVGMPEGDVVRPDCQRQLRDRRLTHVELLYRPGERTLAQTDFSQKTVLVIGAEGEGLRQKTREHCDELVRIPGGRKAVESLNASVATTIGLYEIFRRRE